ncbi:MAG TPA: L-threonylcarbamoyladenylate synthase, partial [Candidatus Paceibacterota bacterium]|nr:L-threonylcarbamoyladenylate synthase [Candidatus Paceibacterota bacterium]
MEILLLQSKNFEEIVKKTTAIIRAGGVVIAPTDTVYGMLADATNELAIKRLFAIKNRPLSKSLPIFIESIEAAKNWAIISTEQEAYLKNNWPGKVTTILKRKNDTKIFGVEAETIALRIPNFPFINSLLKLVQLPLAGTSANLSGQPASTKINEILEQFANEKILPDLVINAGDLEIS